jgi:diadenosine tetraphosphate (Ap4A) HIT family hydrolase
LVDFWTAKLHVRHETVNLLLRDWLVHGVSWKSVNHLHFHLIPDCPIGSKEWTDWPDREFMDDAEYQKFTDAIRELYL